MSSGLPIRPVHDLPEIDRCARLMAESDPWKRLGRSEEECKRALVHAAIRIHGAIDGDGRVIGFLASMDCGIGSAPLIEYVCVAEEGRNKGIGSSLISFFENAMYPDARNLYLFVSDINPLAQRLYLRLGYLPVGAIPNYNFETQTEFLFRKTRGPKQSGPLPPA